MTPELKNLQKIIKRTQEQFPMMVEASALEVIEIAKDIANSIGEISVAEAEYLIIREFADRLRKSQYEWVK